MDARASACRADGGSRVVEGSTGADPEVGPGAAPRPSPLDDAAAALAGDGERTEVARRLVPPSSDDGLTRLAVLTTQLLACSWAQVVLLTDAQVVVGAAGASSERIGHGAPLSQALCALVAHQGAPLVVEDAADDPVAREVPVVASGQVGAYAGVPLVLGDGTTVGALCALHAAPRAWTAVDVDLLQQLAASVVAELELAAMAAEQVTERLRWRLAIDAAGLGSFDLDLPTGRLAWDEAMLDLFGYDEDEFDGTYEAFRARLHPDDEPRVSLALHTAIARCGEFRAEYRVLLPDRSTRWVQARGHALAGEDGSATRLIGVAYDTTSTRTGEERVARVLETMSAAFYSLDRDWRFTYVNAEAERLLGRTREELLGADLWEEFPATVAGPFEEVYRAAMASGRPATFEAHYPAPLDGWYELRVWPGPDGLAVYFIDITERRRARQDATDAAGRLALLSRVSAELAGTLDAEETVARLARLVVPTLADWCVVTLVDDDRLRDVGSWHVDPEKRPLLARYSGLRLRSMSNPAFLSPAHGTVQEVVMASDATERISAVLAPGEARQLLHELAPETALVLPLAGRDRTVGLLTLYSGPLRPPLGEDDIATAREVAERAGLALDNARLYAQQRDLAEGLQRSLLTEPPEPDHLQVVVRYAPAAQAAQVGGDWYDAFLQRDGATVLVIGDVVGHDIAAAASMGQVRGLLRGIAYSSGAGPARVLTELDEAIEGLQLDTSATVLVARLEQTPGERARGVSGLRWSNAGHPPPMVVDPQGRVEVLAGPEGELLLGVDPTAARTESLALLERGSTVLLYTDGLVERRGQDLDEGLALLRDTLGELHGRDLDDVCDAVLARMLPEHHEDDVALVAVRLHRQDRPRPPEAGPHRVAASVPPEPA